jgi:2OG-Fe(II) oxygenase superfamily
MTSSFVTSNSSTRLFGVAMEEEQDEGEDWISLLPRRRSSSSLLRAWTSMPSFQAFVQGKSSVFHSSTALSSTLMEEDVEKYNNDKNDDRGRIIATIQDDARLLKALGVGTSAGVVSHPNGVPPIRQGVTQLWLQVPSHPDEDGSDDDEDPLPSRRTSSSSSTSKSLLAGNLDGRAQLFRLVEDLRCALEEDVSPLSSTAPTTTTSRRRRLPPDQVELSYLWYDGSSSSTTEREAGAAGRRGAYYGRHIDTPRISTSRRRVRCVSFLLYLGGDTDEPWNGEDHGGQLRIYLDPPPALSLQPTMEHEKKEGNPAANDNDNDNNKCDYVNVIPECGTLVLFDSATVPHEVLPTRRDRLAVVGWFGGTQMDL